MNEQPVAVGAQKLNEAFRIRVGELEDKIGARLDGASHSDYGVVIPLRAIKKIHDISLMQIDVLEAILRKVPLRDKTEGVVYPYQNAEIEVHRRAPSSFHIGQTFVLKRKLLGLMDAMSSHLFRNFDTGGLSKMPPLRVYGETAEGEEVIGIYIPPIIEVHGSYPSLIDGIHRSFLCKSAGTTINAVHVWNAGSKLPFRPISWKECYMVDEKPSVEQRYFDLNKALFRNLTNVGIDG